MNINEIESHLEVVEKELHAKLVRAGDEQLNYLVYSLSAISRELQRLAQDSGLK
jgi:predicted nuclease with TOPRIM domain|tara:strand:- start:172 stop:333 length:162 start_codon:yes stop_codon:yes gene_type:complete